VPAGANDDNVKKFFDFSFDYHRIQSLTDDEDKAAGADTVIKQMCACLAEGFPIIFGFKMYKEADHKTSEFFDNKNWTDDVFNIQIDKLENRGDDDGGHAVLCVGFDSDRRLFRVMNSWSPTWKDRGFFWMPFSWFEQAGSIEIQVDGKPEERRIRLAYDLWMIRPHLAPLLRDHDPVQ
jgi:C1A family cysteine protease